MQREQALLASGAITATADGTASKNFVLTLVNSYICFL